MAHRVQLAVRPFYQQQVVGTETADAVRTRVNRQMYLRAGPTADAAANVFIYVSDPNLHESAFNFVSSLIWNGDPGSGNKMYVLKVEG